MDSGGEFLKNYFLFCFLYSIIKMFFGKYF
jgi:hypothetical protein